MFQNNMCQKMNGVILWFTIRKRVPINSDP